MRSISTFDTSPLLSTERLVPPPTQGKRRGGLTGLLLVVALVVAIIGLMRGTSVPDKVWVLSAREDILPGSRIDFSELRPVEYPKSIVTREMLTDPKLFSSVVGREAVEFIPAGEPLRTTAITNEVSPPLSSQLSSSERAMTITLDEDGLVDHEILAGDRVDVMATKSSGERRTAIVCADIKVLSIMKRDAFRSRRTGKEILNRITLAVTPTQAVLVSEAKELGKVQLLLRSKQGFVSAEKAEVGESDVWSVKAPSAKSAVPADLPSPPAPPALLPSPPPTAPVIPQLFPPPHLTENTPAPASPPLPAPRPKGWVVEVFSGSKRTLREFGADDTSDMNGTTATEFPSPSP